MAATNGSGDGKGGDKGDGKGGRRRRRRGGRRRGSKPRDASRQSAAPQDTAPKEETPQEETPSNVEPRPAPAPPDGGKASEAPPPIRDSEPRTSEPAAERRSRRGSRRGTPRSGAVRPEQRPADGKREPRRGGPRSPGGDAQPAAPSDRPTAAPRIVPPVVLPSRKGFHRFDDVRDCFDRVLASSVAEETELVWLERRRAAVAIDGEPAPIEAPRLSVLVRVVEGGRQGWYRTDTADPNLLESGIRQALALSRVQPRLKKRPILPTDAEEFRAPRELHDREVARLQPEVAREMLRELCDGEEEARLSWSEARLVIHNNHGLRRSAALSEITLEVRSGAGPGAGYAAGSARRLEGLDVAAIRDRARAAHGEPGTLGELPAGELPVVLSPEAAVEWLDVLNAHAFSGRSFLEGTSFLSRHRNIQVFDSKVHLYDDGTTGEMALPFDFEGSLKSRHDLIVAGQPSTPALSQAQGAIAGLAPTANAVGGQDAMFSNLCMQPGDAANLLAAANGGLHIGWLEHSECFEPQALHISTTARGVRRIRDGALAEALPDLAWEVSLLAVLGRVLAVGNTAVTRAMPSAPLGGISAPGLALAETGGFQVL